MNNALLFKSLFLIAILLLLVMMGINNPQPVSFHLRPLLSKPQSLPAAYMYFGFFAIGFVTGAMLKLGGGKGAGAGSKGKSDK